MSSPSKSTKRKDRTVDPQQEDTEIESPKEKVSKENNTSNAAVAASDEPLALSHADLDSLLKFYYQHLFPFHYMYNWLSYGDAKCFLNREMSYTIMVGGDEIYARYKSYPNVESFATAIRSENPIKLDIGAIYPCPPEDRSSLGAAYVPVSKELVFDIDMTDYDDVRFCCSGAAICLKCWPLMTAAVLVTDRRLREDFGFKHLLWVYSGRRGVHCWVCDERARQLTTSGRGAVVNYLSLVGERSKDEGDERVVRLPKRLHPMVAEACDSIRPLFEQYIVDQDLFGAPERWKVVTQLIPCLETQTELDTLWRQPENASDDATRRWGQVRAMIEKHSKNASTYQWAPHVVKEIMLSIMYPRFDAAVSRGFNHLLKSPFVVHPKTGRVCVPIDPTRATEFNPLDVPTVAELVNAVDTFDKHNESDAVDEAQAALDNHSAHLAKTRLLASVELFNQFLAPLQKSTAALARKRRLDEARENADENALLNF